MIEVNALRAEDIQRVPSVGEFSNFAQNSTSDDSVSNSDNDTHKPSSIAELNLNEGNDHSSQSDYTSKLKTIKISSHGQKPYEQLSAREKLRLMERQSRRVLRMRGEMQRYGINRSISQSGKDDLLKLNDNLPIGLRRRENSTCSVGSLDSCEDLSSSFEEDEDLERNLESWYQAGCNEDYFENDRSSRELVKNYMDMEDEIEQLQKSLREARMQQNAMRRAFNVEEEMEKIRVFREEIESLMRENEVLETENEKLRLRLPSKTS